MNFPGILLLLRHLKPIKDYLFQLTFFTLKEHYSLKVLSQAGLVAGLREEYQNCCFGKCSEMEKRGILGF